MHDVFAVGKGNKVQQRAHDADRVLLAEVAARHDLIKQLASAAQLHHLQHQGQQDTCSSQGCSHVGCQPVRRRLNNQTASEGAGACLKRRQYLVQTQQQSSSSARRRSGRPAQAHQVVAGVVLKNLLQLHGSWVACQHAHHGNLLDDACRIGAPCQHNPQKVVVAGNTGAGTGPRCCGCDRWCCRHAAVMLPLLQTACTRGRCLCTVSPSLWLLEPDAAFPTALTANSCPVWLWVQAMTLQ